MNRAKNFSVFSGAAVFVLLLCGFAANGSWLKQVPDSARAHKSPMVSTPGEFAAGHKLFVQHCAACHGLNAEGRGKKPSLHTSRVHDATEGELEWLLRNGELGKGMPSWSKLPDQQRWQLVIYLKSLPAESPKS